MVKSTVAFRSSILCFLFQCQAFGAENTSCANTAPPTTGIHTEPPLAISATSPTGASHENPAPSNTTTAPFGLNPSLPRHPIQCRWLPGRKSTVLPRQPGAAVSQRLQQGSVFRQNRAVVNPMVVTPPVLAANTLPPCISAMALTIARPRPWP